MKFKEWFENRLSVKGAPKKSSIESNTGSPQYDVIINVTDEYYPSIHSFAEANGIRYHWFPLVEFGFDMGINSVYAALNVLYEAEKARHRVLLHCHAGINRSKTIQAAYYYMRTGEHLDQRLPVTEESKAINAHLGITSEPDYMNNRLINNCMGGRLPGLWMVQDWLKSLQVAFDKDEFMRGGQLEGSKLKHIN